MLEIENSKRGYDLEKRTLEFARKIRNFVRKLPRTVSNMEDGKQLIRASGSAGANYIEANESLSKKDFVMRIKIPRKEAKESCYWLNLVFTDNKPDLDNEKGNLIRESIELTKIFGSIVEKSK